MQFGVTSPGFFLHPCCLPRVTRETAEFQARQGSGAQEPCNFNERWLRAASAALHQLRPGWVPGPARRAPSTLGDAGLRAVGGGGRRVWQTLHTVGRGGQSSTFGASEKPLPGVEEDVPLPVVTPCRLGYVGGPVGLACVQERKQAEKVTRLVSHSWNCHPGLPALISVLREAALVTTKGQATFSEPESHVASPVNGDARPGETPLFDRNHLVRCSRDSEGRLLQAPA